MLSHCTAFLLQFARKCHAGYKIPKSNDTIIAGSVLADDVILLLFIFFWNNESQSHVILKNLTWSSLEVDIWSWQPFVTYWPISFMQSTHYWAFCRYIAAKMRGIISYMQRPSFIWQCNFPVKYGRCLYWNCKYWVHIKSHILKDTFPES